ncbi:MAG TPA: hypothetical protein VFS83_01305, partial [Ktedonobacterales bacterium]|nr:hypothetical protein [Ktedonobacterales bacterium]
MTTSTPFGGHSTIPIDDTDTRAVPAVEASPAALSLAAALRLFLGGLAALTRSTRQPHSADGQSHRQPSGAVVLPGRAIGLQYPSMAW